MLSVSKSTTGSSESRIGIGNSGNQAVVVTTIGRRLGLRIEERKQLSKRLDRLTPREREVAYAVFLGGDNEALANRLCIAMPTLRTHLMRINQKLGTTSKSDIVHYVAMSLLDAYRNGTITASST